MRRLLLISTAVLLLLIIAAVALTPMLVERELEREIASTSGLATEIGGLRINLLEGSATVSGVVVGQSLVSVDRIEVDLAYTPLLDREVQIESLVIEGLSVAVRRVDGTLMLPGIASAGESGEEYPSTWRIVLAHAEIRDSLATLEEAGATQELRVERCVVERFTVGSPAPFPVQFEGAVNGSRATFEGDIAVRDDGVAVEGDTTLAQFNLAGVAGYLPVPLTGSIGTPGLALTLDAGEELALNSSGAIHGNELQGELVGYHFDAGQLRWEGSTGFSLAADEAISLAVDGALTGDRIAFEDGSTTPPVALQFADLSITVGGREGPAYQGPGAVPFEVAMGVRQGESGTIEVSANLGGILDKPAGKGTITVRRFDLHRVAPYLDVAEIRSGRLNLDSEVALEGDTITLNNRIRIERLQIEQTEREEGGEMPLGVALNLLKDKDDRIDLEVPITSVLGELEVDPADIIQVAVRNAAKKAALSYAAVALQPFGAILLVRNLAAAAAEPRLAPLQFAAGSGTLDENGLGYVEKIGALLNQRPRLELTLCGVATQADRAAREASQPGQPVTPESLLDLATTRRAAVAERLQQAGIARERLHDCAPAMKEDASAPRIELIL